jgi:triacylglycerol esterase/lipase EstA (alpha/beta hydrolase family)
VNARQRQVLAVLAVLLVALAAVYVVRERRDVVAVPQDRLGPVVLVPGYGGGTDALKVLAGRLEREGRQAVVVQLPGDATGDLREQAEALDAAVQPLLAAGAPSVDLVGFSAGGVVARLWVKDEGGAEHTRRVVTLGSPHHGTDVARLANIVRPGSCPVACRQLATGSSLLNDLNGGDETPDGPLWVSVWTAVDETVTPPDTARLDGAVDVRLQSVCADARTEHGSLPVDPLVQGVVLRALAAASPQSLDASDCEGLRG